VGLRNSWPGAALAALSLIVYELLFPWIASVFIHPGEYGETAGFLLILLSFFYYFAFLLLIGAEINSWLAGHRETPADVPTLLHDAIIHRRFPEPASEGKSPANGNGSRGLAHHNGAANGAYPDANKPEDTEAPQSVPDGREAPLVHHAEYC
jgi:hypothetical protein